LPFLAAASCGTLVLAWLIASSRIPLSGDQSIIALMGRFIAQGGGHPVFCWGSTYGGTFEPHVLAAAFAVFGATMTVFRGVMCVFYAVLAAGSVAFASRFFGLRAAVVAAVYFALPPFFLPYKVLTSDGAYATVTLLALAALWGALAADEAHAARRSITLAAAALGGVSGFGLWITPVTLPFTAAVLAWTAWRTWGAWKVRDAGAFLAGLVFASAPWWIWNARHGWASLRAPEIGTAAASSLPERLASFLSTSLPVLVGAARPNFGDDPHASFPGALVLLPALVVVLAVPALRAMRTDARVGLLALALAVQAVATIFSARSSPAEPRYLVAAYVVAPALLGAASSRLAPGRLRALWVAGFAALLAAHLSSAVHARRHLEDVDDSQVTAPLGRLIAALHEAGATHVWTDYWTAYRLSFESGGTIEATPIPLDDGTRDPHLDASVRAAADPAVVLLPPRTACFETYLRETGAAVEPLRVDAFTVFRHLPPDVRDLVRAAGTLPMPRAAYDATWSVPSLPASAAAGSTFRAHLRVRNAGPCTWMNGVRLLAEWSGAGTFRQPVPAPDRRVAPGETADISVLLAAPPDPGAYRLRLDLEQQGVAAFSEKGGRPFTTEIRIR
jgi:4-amino-4-deoxy-L-arabinose transferase-like glycosyltransferase